MPQRSLHPVVYILLMWLTIISIIQLVFIIFFFTMGEKPQSPDKQTKEPGAVGGPQFRSTPPPTTPNPFLQNNIMLTFKANGANNAINWISVSSTQTLMSKTGETLEIKKDGYYFLNFKVTLQDGDGCEKSAHTVQLKNNGKILLEGWIDTNKKTTGQLSKVKDLTVGGKLEVTIDPKTTCLNNSESVTHLDVIFMNTN